MADYLYGTDRDRQRALEAFGRSWDAASEPEYIPLSERAMAFENRPDTAQNRVEDFLYNTFGRVMSPRGAMGATNAGMGAIDLAVGDLPYALADGRYGDAAGSLATDVAINALGLKALQAGGKIAGPAARRIFNGIDSPAKYSEGYSIGDDLAPRDGSLYEPIPNKPSAFRVPGQVTPEDKSSWPRFDARPINEVELTADQYMRRNGLSGSGVTRSFSPFDEDRARRIAQEFEAMQHNPGDPRVRKSYDAMIEETIAQLKAIEDMGIDIQFNKNGFDPYAATPAMAYEDLVKNGRISVFPTDDGFGTLSEIDDNPLLKRVGRVGDLQNATANDAFRAVHDIFGHLGPGNPMFRGPGEERAWEKHARMYSPEARPAMTTETRGQNSWVNYGPFAERNARSDGANTVYADQKVGLMQPWTWELP
jgi:hypothetical protein